MQRYGQPSGQPSGQQVCNFFILMLLAATQALSGTMLRRKGFLRTGEGLLRMSQETKISLWKKYAEPSTNLTPRQRRKLLLFRAFLWEKLLGKQSWQPCQMRVPPHVFCHLMTMGIPRIRIFSIRMPESPVKPAWQLTGSVVYDPSGFMYNGRSHDWSLYHHQITAIKSHPNKPLVALMHSDGNVWIGKIGDRDNLFRLIHSPEKEDEKATAIAFNPVEPLIAVAVKARIMVYKISQISHSLKPELHFAVSFYESGYFCPRPKYSANTLGWNPTGTFLTAISAGNLSMCFFLKPDTTGVIGGFNGGIKYAELRSIGEDISPTCSCFSPDGNLVMTGYHDGTLMLRSAVHTVEKGLSLICLKILEKVLPGQIVKIVSHPHNPSVFAIEVQVRLSHTVVLIVLVSHDGSVTITATIPDAKSPYFHEGWLLVSSGNKILFHKMNRCNIPCLVTEFHLQGNGPFGVRIDTFCVITAPNGKVMLHYSISGKSKLCTAEIALS
jgi:WD40 repeat protein